MDRLREFLSVNDPADHLLEEFAERTQTGRLWVGDEEGEWTLLRAGVDSLSIGAIMSRILRGLRFVDTVPYWAHFRRKDALVVMFRRVSRLRPGGATWGPAVSSGTSLRIAVGEPDFNPRRFEGETDGESRSILGILGRSLAPA